MKRIALRAAQVSVSPGVPDDIKGSILKSMMQLQVFDAANGCAQLIVRSPNILLFLTRRPDLVRPSNFQSCLRDAVLSFCGVGDHSNISEIDLRWLRDAGQLLKTRREIEKDIKQLFASVQVNAALFSTAKLLLLWSSFMSFRFKSNRILQPTFAILASRESRMRAGEIAMYVRLLNRCEGIDAKAASVLRKACAKLDDAPMHVIRALSHLRFKECRDLDHVLWQALLQKVSHLSIKSIVATAHALASRIHFETAHLSMVRCLFVHHIATRDDIQDLSFQDTSKLCRLLRGQSIRCVIDHSLQLLVEELGSNRNKRMISAEGNLLQYVGRHASCDQRSRIAALVNNLDWSRRSRSPHWVAGSALCFVGNNLHVLLSFLGNNGMSSRVARSLLKSALPSSTTSCRGRMLKQMLEVAIADGRYGQVVAILQVVHRQSIVFHSCHSALPMIEGLVSTHRNQHSWFLLAHLSLCVTCGVTRNRIVERIFNQPAWMAAAIDSLEHCGEVARFALFLMDVSITVSSERHAFVDTCIDDLINKVGYLKHASISVECGDAIVKCFEVGGRNPDNWRFKNACWAILAAAVDSNELRLTVGQIQTLLLTLRNCQETIPLSVWLSLLDQCSQAGKTGLVSDDKERLSWIIRFALLENEKHVVFRAKQLAVNGTV